jgi:hypothetical protein
LPDRFGECRFDFGAERRMRSGIVRLHQRIPGMAGQWIGQRRKLRTRERDAIARYKLEAGQPVTDRLAHRAEQGDRCRYVAEGDPRGRRRARAGEELEDRRGDDAQRAFAAQENLLQVVSGIVLAQPAQAVPYFAVGEHDFEAEHELTSIAVAQHRRAAGIGRQIAADRTASFGGERQREQHAGRRGRLLNAGQRHPRFNGHRRVVGVDRAHAIHSRQGQHDLIAGRVRRGAAAEPRVASLRHDGHPMTGAATHDGRDFVGRPRADHCARAAAIALSPVSYVRRDVRVGG